MRVLIVADDLFAARERSLLTRLEVGLADEGVLVVYAVPQRVIDATPGGAAELSGVFTKVVPYNPSSFSIGRRLAVTELETKLTELPGGVETFDLVHVFGGGAWSLAASIADHLEIPLVVEAWRAGLADQARQLVAEGARLDRTLFIAPDPDTERELTFVAAPSSRQNSPPAPRTRCIPWGVLTPSERRVREAGAGVDWPATFMLVGSGRDADAWQAALKGCRRAVDEGLDVLLFADAQAARRSDLWSAARGCGMLDRLSLIDDLESRRDLVLHGTVLVLPEARGEQHSITLEAMAGEMLVVAAKDQHSSLLQDGRTCVTVDPGSVDQWATSLTRLIRDRHAANALAESARFFVQMHRKASDQVKGVLAAYADVTAGGSLPFRG